MRALDGVRVVQLGRSISAAYCGVLLAGFGAEVCALDSADDSGAAELSVEGAAWFDQGRRRITIDWNACDASHTLRDLLRQTDVLIDARRPCEIDPFGLDAESLARDYPRLITCRITPFGVDGPYRDIPADDITLYALSGLMTCTGEGTREPLAARPRISQVSAGLNAYIACLMALMRRGRDGEGDFIDLSIQEAALENNEVAIAEYLHTGKIARRNGDEHAMVPWRTYACGDGQAAILSGPMRNWTAIAQLIDDPELRESLAGPRYAHMRSRIADRKAFETLLRPWLLSKTRRELFIGGQRAGLAWSYLATLGEALEDPQFAARGFFRRIEMDDGRSCRVPAFPFRSSRGGWSLSARRPEPLSASALGQRWRNESRQTPAPTASTPTAPKPSASKPTASKRESSAPLSGLRVLDFTHDWAGPHASRLLGDYGAEVIKIEYPGRLDGMRGPDPERINDFARFWQLHRNKRSITLDLKRPDHYAMCCELVRDCDLVIENSRAGVMQRLGLDYPKLRALRPDIVMLSMSAFGADGPYADFAGYGGTIEALSGLQSLTGYADGASRYRIREMDVLNGTVGAIAALTALHHRDRSGEGQWIDLSESETCCWLIGEFFAAASVSGEQPAAIGNGHLRYAPHGCWRCAGEDRWLTLSVRSDVEWQAFARLIGTPDWATDARFATAAARQANHALLDTAIGTWCRQQAPDAAMHALAAIGVAAGGVLNAADLATDPHLQARQWFQSVDGVKLPGLPFRFRHGGGRVSSRGPNLGHSNAEVGQLYGVALDLADALKSRPLRTAFESA